MTRAECNRRFPGGFVSWCWPHAVIRQVDFVDIAWLLVIQNGSQQNALSEIGFLKLRPAPDSIVRSPPGEKGSNVYLHCMAFSLHCVLAARTACHPVVATSVADLAAVSPRWYHFRSGFCIAPGYSFVASAGTRPHVKIVKTSLLCDSGLPKLLLHSQRTRQHLPPSTSLVVA